MEFDVIAEAAAEGTCMVFDDCFAWFCAGESGSFGDFVSETAKVFHEVPGGFEGEGCGGYFNGDSFEVGGAGCVGTGVEDVVRIWSAGDENDSLWGFG